MRTLAHELVHLAQDEQNQDIDGSDGSKHENQANAVAGVIMRKWADKDPSLFETSVQELKIEKPDPKDTLGVKRKEMPQVKSDDYAEFIEYLKKNGATFTTPSALIVVTHAIGRGMTTPQSSLYLSRAVSASRSICMVAPFLN